MYITYQGTAAAEGAPAIYCDCDFCRYARAAGGKEIRMRSGALIDGVLKLDFGPDAYAQSLRFGHSYAAVNHVFITHSHPDHLAADDLARVTAPDAYRKIPLTVWGNERVGELLAPYVAAKKGMLAFRRIRPFESCEADGYTVTALRAVHAQKEEALFYLIEKDGRSLLYAHDTDEFTEEDMEFLKNRRINLISLDCTNGRLDLDYIGHMGVSDNLRMREKLLAIGAADENTQFVANHFSHNGLAPYGELERMLKGFIVSYDGLTLRV